MKPLLLAYLLLVLGQITSAQGKRDPTLDRLASEFAAAFTARDSAKVASFYADDAVVMPPNQQMVRGREKIEAYYKNGFATSSGTLRLQPIESAVVGLRGFEVGTSSLSVSGKAESAGKYVVIYGRVKDQWKIVYDIFNDDAPPSR
jgi:ketosteroid isomerase-like protein